VTSEPPPVAAYVQILTAWFIYAFLGVIARGIPLPLPVLLFTMALGGAVLCLIVRPGKITWQPDALVIAVILLADLICLFMAFQRISFVTVIALHYAGPILVTLLAPIILKEKFNPKSFICACIGLIAVAVICRFEIIESYTAKTISGIGFAVLSAVTLALNIVFQRKLMKATVNFRASVLQYNFWIMIGSAVIFGIFFLPYQNFIQAITWHRFELAFMAGLLTMGLASLLFNSAARSIDADIIARMAFTEIAWVTLLGFLIYQERPTFAQLAAVSAIFGMSYLAQRDGRRRASRPLPPPAPVVINDLDFIERIN
jgi:drug/metabolite transporter (DMT)-like permease